MTTVFLSGSRRASRLNDVIRERLDRIAAQGFAVLVGDANGADSAFQKYLHEKGYNNVTVFHVGTRFRNNIGEWNTESVTPPRGARGFAKFAAKDQEMAHRATHALMLWDGKSKGTLANALRMAQQGKVAVLYLSPESRFLDIRCTSDWESVADRFAPDVGREVRSIVAREAGATTGAGQASLFTG